MKQLTTQAIILGRTNYQEADRILNLLTPNYGKLRLMAKGVRKVKSKLAGGIELFSISDITFIRGRGDIGTLISTRLIRHYEYIVKHLDRTMLAYESIKQLNRVTEDEPEAEYFDLLKTTFEALNNPIISPDLIQFWFSTQLLKLNGHTPNLKTDQRNHELSSDTSYTFNVDTMAFVPLEGANFQGNHIKLLRLAFGGQAPYTLSKIKDVESLLTDLKILLQTMLQTYVRL